MHITGYANAYLLLIIWRWLELSCKHDHKNWKHFLTSLMEKKRKKLFLFDPWTIKKNCSDNTLSFTSYKKQSIHSLASSLENLNMGISCRNSLSIHRWSTCFCFSGICPSIEVLWNKCLHEKINAKWSVWVLQYISDY